MADILLVGIAEAGVMHQDPLEFSLDDRFRMVKESGVFDYLDKTPPPQEAHLYRAAMEQHGLPLTAGGFYYRLGRDEPLLEWHLRLGREFGARVHNVQIFAADCAGHPVSDARVAEAYLRAAELGEETGVTPCLEVHVDMWSEHFGRVERVAALVEARGAVFNLTLDHSHVIFKIDNPDEQKVQGMDREILSGAVVLDPRVPGNITQRWIDAGWVKHAHARPAAPNGRRNPWMLNGAGQPGRGIQYPFLRPAPGEWHSPWDERELEPWKVVLRQLLRHHARDESSQTATISTEMIPFTDYGGGAKYSLFDHSVACARWIREEWARIRIDHDAGNPVRLPPNEDRIFAR